MRRAVELIGRDAESRALRQLLVDARRGRGATLFIAGEPGIGKTRLANEALGYALDAGMVALRGRCGSTGPAMPFRPLAEALLSLARARGARPPVELGPYLPVLGRLVPEWATGPRGDDSLIVLAEAVLRLTAHHGRAGGCLFVVDDLHEADPETLAVLDYMASNLTGQPVAVLATVRTAPSAAYDLVGALTRRADARTLTLDRLSPAGVRAVAASCLECAPEEIADDAAAQLSDHSRGNPFMVEELVHSLVTADDLVAEGGRWRLAPNSRNRVPPTLVQAIEHRAAQLGADGARVLSAAAVLGRSFPLSVVQLCLGLGDRDLVAHIRSAAALRLVVPDERGPDWYAFEHPLTEEALLSTLAPADLEALSRSAAEAVVELHPELSDPWCTLVAHLRRRAGDRWGAATAYLAVARSALAGQGPATAIAVVDEALELVRDRPGGPAELETRQALGATLLYALAEDGNFDRAAQVAEQLRLVGATTRLDLQVRLAWAAQVSGRWEEGLAGVAAARALLPPDAGPAATAAVDAVDAYLTVCRTGVGADHVSHSEELARRAVTGATERGDPALACQAWYAVGFATRGRSLAESNAAFRRTLDIATEHGLVSWRNHGLIGVGSNTWLADGDGRALRYAHQEALHTGCVTLAHNAHAVLAFDAALTADFARATAMVDECVEQTSRLGLHSVTRYAVMVRAVIAAHRARRRDLREAISEFRALGGDQSREAPLVRGLAELFGALLEEDREQAREMAARLDDEYGGQQTFFHFAGTFGLTLLLAVLDDAAGWADHARIAAAESARMRWNRQFVEFARAVLLGRDGRADAAAEAVTAALAWAEPFPTARHLCLRLVADSAIADGWGEPERWLAEAETYFHGGGVTAVAGACRARMRRLGLPVRQHREGTDRIPKSLRKLGVTGREFEVYLLLPEHLSNRALAGRLQISVRTVEKHVANLLAKIGAADRVALCEHAADLLAGRPSPG